MARGKREAKFVVGAERINNASMLTTDDHIVYATDWQVKGYQIVCCRKEDEGGWWLRDGSGLADSAAEAGYWWRVIEPDAHRQLERVGTHCRQCGRTSDP